MVSRWVLAVASAAIISCSASTHSNKRVADGAVTKLAGKAIKTPPPTNAVAPPPKIRTPMAGEPGSGALAEARLVEATCTDDPEAVEALVQQMKKAVDASFKEWHAAQPECWREYAERDRMFREGGLGLWGIGEGGGGRGEGIGLGSIGTIGHGAGPRKARLASGTNNQVAGVDEADIVKTDGRFVYLAANGALRIVEALKPRVLSVTRVAGVARELFIEGDRAVVYSSSAAPTKTCRYGYDCIFAGDSTSTRIQVFDIADRTRPKLARTIELSGSLIASRRIGKAVHTVVSDGDAHEPLYAAWPEDFETCGTKESAVRAKFAALKLENERKIRASVRSLPTLRENGVARSLCKGLLRTARGDGKAFTTLVSFDLAADDKPAKTAMIQTRPGAVYASGDALYLSVVQRKMHGPGRWYSFYASVDEVSEVHKFRIGSDPSASRYVGSGVVPGHVLNQFAMDEWYGYLRIATTRGRVPDPKVESAVSILAEGDAGNLVRVGAVQGIAPSEDIRAVRFDSDRGYIVTFKKTDPLFVLDLHHPARPAILGELKIPGFSTYIHRIDRDHLLSIGFDADDHGDFAYYDGVILQLFDVADPKAPRLVHKEKIGTRGSSSEAATNHLAFNYFHETGKLAIPMTICEGGGNGRAGELSFSGLLVYDVSVKNGFARRGGIDHGLQGADCNTWWSNATSMVKRSIFLDNLVYSIAGDRVKVQRMGHFGVDVADIALTP